MALSGSDPRAFALVLDRVLDASRSAVPVHLTSDFDGTLSPFVPFPDESAPLPEAREAFVRFSSLPGLHSLLITGRWLSMMADIFPEPTIDLECSYGLERRFAGDVWQHPQIPLWTPKLEEFRAHVEEAISKVDGVSYRHARDAQSNNAIYIETKPTAVALHDAPARQLFPESKVRDTMLAAINTLDGNYEGLERHDNNGNIEFVAPLELDGALVDKGTVVSKLDGVVVFSGDDIRDADAAAVVRQRSGIVLAVNNKADGVRAGTPMQLLDLADIIFESVEEHARFQQSLSVRSEEEIDID